MARFVQQPIPSHTSITSSLPGRLFDGLQWLDDRMICNGWVYAIVQHRDDPRNVPGEDFFHFYKPKGLIDQYAAFLSRRPAFAPRRVMELGIWDGGSVALWFELFRPQKHVAIDLLPRGDSGYFRRFVAAHGAATRLRTLWGVDQADDVRLQEIIRREFDGPLDLVIDDASHLYLPTRKSFESLFPYVVPGGLYIIEDWAWEHWEDFGRPNHAWCAEESLTRLVHECIECAGGHCSPIAGITVMNGFVAIERSAIPLPTDRPFRLRDHITRRPSLSRQQEARTTSTPPTEAEVGLSVFVVSWHGQHDRAIAIAEAIRNDGGDARIVYSDPDLGRLLDTECPVIRRPDHLFWGDKFTACLRRCETDALLFIQADCDCNDWPGLVHRCRHVLTTVPQCGVWAPHIDGTPYASELSTFFRISGDGIHAAAQTDGLVLGLSRPVLERLRQARLEDNLYGWGIDQMAVAAAYAGGQVAVIDLSQRVVHPPARGYPTDVAQSQWHAFLRQLSPLEQEWHDALWGFVTAAVALKARLTGSSMHLGAQTMPADGPETTAMLEAGVDAARNALLQRCRLPLASHPSATIASGDTGSSTSG